MLLSNLLNLAPLTKVEVSDKTAIRESRIASSNGFTDLPYWYFQHIHTNGSMVVSTSGGCRSNIDAMDVMNILPSKPIRVMAMPSSVFIMRLSLHYPECTTAPTLDCYHPAYVMRAQRDAWGNFDYNVWFENPDLNTNSKFAAPLMDGERQRLKSLTKRCNMPVRNLSATSNWSEDSQARKIERQHAKHAKAFIAAALQGNAKIKTRMASLDA